MTDLHSSDVGGPLFEDAPPTGLQKQLGLIKPGNLNVRHRALLVILVGWVPLLALAVVQSLVARTDVITPLLWEVGVHARYLIAAPLLVIAEAACAPQLNEVIRHFTASGIVGDDDRGRFDEAVDSTRRSLRSGTAEILAILIAYLVAVAAAISYPAGQLPAWAAPVAGILPHFSAAGWWHTLVSMPLLVLLVLSWCWRLALWTRLLWRISRLKLRLVASHPDHCAGLSFLGHSVRAFAIVAMALAVISAGRSAHLVLAGGAVPTQNFAFNAGLLVVTAVLFIGPLLSFVAPLVRAWQHGTLAYGTLADQVGLAFERKWLSQNVDKGALEKPDFSATTDLFGIVANVHAIRFVPVDLKDLVPLAVAMLLPFVPVVLLAVPLDVIWAQVKGMLF